MLTEFVNFWNRCDLTGPTYMHPADIKEIKGGNKKHIDIEKHIDKEPKDFEAFVASPRFGDFNDQRFHLSLLPIPYGGNLARADIVVLLLNPGFSYTDYYAESRVPAFRRRLEMNLRQSFEGVEFPFLWLDPEFCWHSGFSWWEKKLRGVITEIAKKKFSSRYLDALRDLSTRLAQVELVPYHSPSFGSGELIDALPSVEEARRFVKSDLLPSAQAGTKTIIVTRQEVAWGLPMPTENIVVYKGGQTRGASLGRNTPGGRAILKRYGIAPPTD